MRLSSSTHGHRRRTKSFLTTTSALSRPEKTGLSRWSSREMARYLTREEGISVSHNFVAGLWREHGLWPHRQSTFKALDRSPLALVLPVTC